MKCENDTQLHEALTALIGGTTGTMRDALTAIRDYLGKRPTVNADTLEEARRMIKEGLKEVK